MEFGLPPAFTLGLAAALLLGLARVAWKAWRS